MEFVVIIIGKVMQVNSTIGSTGEIASENFLKISIFLNSSPHLLISVYAKPSC